MKRTEEVFCRAAALLEERTGRLIYLCLEPEPGCVFSFADDAVHYFQWQLLDREDDEIVRRHVRICHDVCHAERDIPQPDRLQASVHHLEGGHFLAHEQDRFPFAERVCNEVRDGLRLARARRL